jgi:mannose-6-phosphate isomerase-like protein (cupin superfamily)
VTTAGPTAQWGQPDGAAAGFALQLKTSRLWLEMVVGEFAVPESLLNPLTRAERVERPWGWYENLSVGEGYLVKRLWLAPGQRISLQSHRHRCEHWVVVNGEGLLTLEGTTLKAERGTTLFVPEGACHRAEAGPLALEIVEVQRGGTLSEADIERYEDDFGRL